MLCRGRSRRVTAHKVVCRHGTVCRALNFGNYFPARPGGTVAKLRHVSLGNTDAVCELVSRHTILFEPSRQSHRPILLAALKLSQPKNSPDSFRLAFWSKTQGLTYLHPMARPRVQERKTPHFLREWRKFRGLSQERLAGRIDCSTGLISQLETGETNLSQETLAALAVALQCQPGDLYHDPNAPDFKLWRIINGLSESDKAQALRVIEALTSKTA